MRLAKKQEEEGGRAGGADAPVTQDRLGVIIERY